MKKEKNKKAFTKKVNSRANNYELEQSEGNVIKDTKVEIKWGERYLNVQNAGPYEALIIIAVLATIAVIYLAAR